jgi:hypothetical protein
LQNLAGAFGSSQQAVSSVATYLTTFATSVSNDTKTLGNFAALATSAEGADADAIAGLNKVIETFQKSVDNQQNLLTLEKLAAWDLNIFLTVAGTAVGLIFGPAGAVAGTIFGIVTATVTSFVQIGPDEMVDKAELAREQEEITSMNTEVGQLNSQIAAVQSIANTFASVTAEGSSVSQSVTTATGVWTGLKTSLTTAFDNNTAAQNAQTSKAWSVVRQKADAAMAAWTEAQKTCAAIQGITYNVSPQVVRAPMPKPKS